MIRDVLRLVRVSSFATAPSDVLAGIALGFLPPLGRLGMLPVLPLAFLLVASMLVYWGGLVLNDLLDYEKDRRDRPGRPFVAGALPRSLGIGLLAVCFGGALALALPAGLPVLLGVAAVVLAVILYDAFLKENDFAAALGMGLCRALNLGVGMLFAWCLAFGGLDFAHLPHLLREYWPALLLYFTYISMLTVVGRSETRSRVDQRLRIASGLAAACPLLQLGYVIFSLSTLPFLDSAPPDPPWPLSFELCFSLAAVPALVLATILWRGRSRMLRSDNLPRAAGLWVRDGVLGIVLYNGATLIATQNIVAGVIVSLLFFVSLWLSKRFSPS